MSQITLTEESDYVHKGVHLLLNESNPSSMISSKKGVGLDIGDYKLKGVN